MGKEEHKTDHKTEHQERDHEAKQAKPEVLTKEANAGMSGLVSDRQKLIQYLKDGGKSGISTDFGKPVLVDQPAEAKTKGGKPEVAGSVEYKLAELPDLPKVRETPAGPADLQNILKSAQPSEHQTALIDVLVKPNLDPQKIADLITSDKHDLKLTPEQIQQLDSLFKPTLPPHKLSDLVQLLEPGFEPLKLNQDQINKIEDLFKPKIDWDKLPDLLEPLKKLDLELTPEQVNKIVDLFKPELNDRKVSELVDLVSKPSSSEIPTAEHVSGDNFRGPLGHIVEHKATLQACQKEGMRLRHAHEMGPDAEAREELRLQQLKNEGRITADDIREAHYWRDHNNSPRANENFGRQLAATGATEENVRGELDRAVEEGRITRADEAAILGAAQRAGLASNERALGAMRGDVPPDDAKPAPENPTDRKSLLKNLIDGKTGITGDFGKLTITDSSTSINADYHLYSRGRSTIHNNKDGTYQISTPDNNGGFVEEHFGSRPDDHFVMHRRADGKVEFSEKKGEKPIELIDDQRINAQREKLNELARHKITDPAELARFQADMTRFEKRSHDIEDRYVKQGMSPEAAAKKVHEEVAMTYFQLTRLMEAKDNPAVPLDESKRTMLAEQIMRNAAHPTLIDQGSHNTCNVTTAEVRAYMNHPAMAAKLVTDMATQGHFITKGTEVTINKEAYTNFDNFNNDNPPRPPARDLASQIFEVTAVNIHYAIHPEENAHYEQRKPDPTKTPPETGEYLIDNKTGKPVVGSDGKPVRQPNISDESIVEVGNRITGDEAPESFIRWDKNKSPGVDTVSDEATFQSKLEDAAKHGKLPITIKVHTGNEPFYTDSGAGSAGGSGGWHVVNVTAYNPGPPAKISMDNQWGPAADHTGKNQISVHELYMSMRAPDDHSRMKDLQTDIENAARKGVIDHTQRLELLSLQYKTGYPKPMSLKEYEDQLNTNLKEMKKEFDDRNFSPQEYNKMLGKLYGQVLSNHAFGTLKYASESGLSRYGLEHEMVKIMADLCRKQKQLVDDKEYTPDKKRMIEASMDEFNKLMKELPAHKQLAIKQQIKALTGI